MARELDWTKLPARLQYLASPAEKYGHFQFDDPIIEFLQEQATEMEKQELANLIPKLEEDDTEIHAFFRQHRITQHTEARLVYFLCHLIAIANEHGYLKGKLGQQ